MVIMDNGGSSYGVRALSFAVISSIVPGSIAEELEVVAGDRLVAINGQLIRDIIEYRFACAAEEVNLSLQRQDGQVWEFEIEKDVEEDLGLEFNEINFDGINRCANRCLFCFVDQQPPGMRPALEIKDDDYRLSLVHGNFITLTNLTRQDWERITSLHLGPLYVSVHATDPGLRQRLMGQRRAARIMEALNRLAAARIQVHVQLVLCPGINDGTQLHRTVMELAALGPEVILSIGIVPVGVTRYHHSSVIRGYTPAEAAVVINQVAGWQAGFRRLWGYGLVYAADEFYRLSGEEYPPGWYYDDYPQIENGIGLVRTFVDEWDQVMRQPADWRPSTEPVALVTGVAAAPILQRAVDQLTGKWPALKAQVLPVVNLFWGPAVTAAGLLTGGDLIATINNRVVPGARVVLPQVVIQRQGQLFLDDMSIDALTQQARGTVRLVPATAAGLLAGLKE